MYNYDVINCSHIKHITHVLFADMECYQNQDEGVVIQKEDEIRLKIIGTRWVLIILSFS